MKVFYVTMIIFSYVGAGWLFYLLFTFAPGWTWWLSVPAFIAIEFGAFAYRDLMAARTEKEKIKK